MGLIAIGAALLSFGYSFGKIEELKIEVTRQHALLAKNQTSLIEMAESQVTLLKELKKIENKIEEN